DKDIDIPIWDEISNVIRKHGYDTEDVIGFIDRFTFYNDTKKAYTVIQSGEEAIYACIMIRKGVIK
ncbi:MAG: fucose isomerase, partial [Clostridiales bacterium]|nr:fucose isomerase [Clostridiales bacterium]